MHNNFKRKSIYTKYQAVSNASMSNWSFDEVDTKLQKIMKNIFDISYETAKEYGCKGDLLTGANIAGFKKVADSMIDQGAV